MCNSEDLNARFEEPESYMYNELHQLIKNNQGVNNTVKKDFVLQSKLQKYKPSKHRKAYRIENNYKNRCYAR